jgi:hypothetical protein
MDGAVRDTTRQEESGMEFELSSTSGTDGLTAYRTVVDRDGADTHIDTVIFDPDIVEQLVSDIDPRGTAAERTLSLMMPTTYVDGYATDEQAIEVPAAAVSSWPIITSCSRSTPSSAR